MRSRSLVFLLTLLSCLFQKNSCSAQSNDSLLREFRRINAGLISSRNRSPEEKLKSEVDSLSRLVDSNKKLSQALLEQKRAVCSLGQSLHRQTDTARQQIQALFSDPFPDDPAGAGGNALIGSGRAPLLYSDLTRFARLARACCKDTAVVRRLDKTLEFVKGMDGRDRPEGSYFNNMPYYAVLTSLNFFDYRIDETLFFVLEELAGAN